MMHYQKYQRILLIHPHETEAYGFSNPPLGLLYIAGTLLAHGFDVQVVDGFTEGQAGIKRRLIDYRPDLVGITCLTPGRTKAFEVARLAKEISPDRPVVFGGVHATIMYRQILNHFPCIDLIVLGEGEQTFLELALGKAPSHIDGLAFRENNEIRTTSPRQYSQDLDSIPFPAYHLIDLRKYPPLGQGVYRGVDLSREPNISIIFSRGCIGRCTFCSTWWIWRGWRGRSGKNMADELELLNRRFGIRRLSFADDAMTVNREETVKLCDEIMSRQLNIAFEVTTRTDCVDELLLKKLKQAGCFSIGFGIETGSPRLLRDMKKDNDLRNSEQAIKLAKKAGLRVVALLIVGNVGETPETIQDTYNFLKRSQPDIVNLCGGLWIFPGTQLYYSLRKRGLISDDFWLSEEPYQIYTQEHSLEKLRAMETYVRGYQNRLQRWNSEIRNAFRGNYLPLLLHQKIQHKTEQIRTRFLVTLQNCQKN